MNRFFGIFMVGFVLTVSSMSSNVLAGNWNSGETTGLSKKVLQLKARDLCKVYTTSKDPKYKSLSQWHFVNLLSDESYDTCQKVLKEMW